MKMVSLQLPKKTEKELKKESIPVASQEKYPYSSRIELTEDVLEKMPHLKECKLGEKLNITALGEVINIRKIERQGEKDRHTVEVQLTHMGVQSKDSFEAAFNEKGE